MILLEPKACELITADALQSFPDECCGFMLGEETETGTRIVREALVVNNAKPGDKRRRFEIAPTDYLQAEKYASENDLLLLGIYHSHPLHPAIPSEHDRVAAQPWFSYIIVSVSENKIENTLSWRLNDDRIFEPEPVSLPSFINK